MGLFRKGTKKISLRASKPPPCTTSGMVWFDQKIFFLIFVIRGELKKFSEMCVWIVGFGQKSRNWYYF